MSGSPLHVAALLQPRSLLLISAVHFFYNTPQLLEAVQQHHNYQALVLASPHLTRRAL